KSVVSVGWATSAAFVVGVPPRALIFSAKYKACPSSSVISASKKGLSAGRSNPDTTLALYVYWIAAAYSLAKSTFKSAINCFKSVVSVGWATSAAFVVGVPPRALIFSAKYKACPSSSVISASKKGLSAGRSNPDTTLALYVYWIAAAYSLAKSTFKSAINCCKSLSIKKPPHLFLLLHNDTLSQQ